MSKWLSVCRCCRDGGRLLTTQQQRTDLLHGRRGSRYFQI